MNFNQVPTLQYVALVKIASRLWNEEDVRAVLRKYSYHPPSDWKLGDEMINKISQLPLPELLGKSLNQFIKQMGLEILRWIEYHKEFIPENFVLRSLDKLCWTQKGTLDRKRIAEVLVKNVRTAIDIRYKLACVYCLERDIPVLYSRISQNRRLDFRAESATETKQIMLVDIWTINDEVTEWLQRSSGRRADLVAFEHAVLGGNKVAAAHFFPKLTARERNSLGELSSRLINERFKAGHDPISQEYYSDVLCFLLSKITKKQQRKLFAKFPCEVVKCFLDWPLQSLFIRMANYMFTFMSQVHYNLLLCAVVEVVESCKDFNHQDLFKELWKQSPYSYKKHVLQTLTTTSNLLSRLFRLEDKGNIEVILKDASVQEREEIIFCDRGKDICKALVHRNKLDLVNFFINHCTSSADTKNKFKEELQKHVHYRSNEMPQEEKDMWNRFFKDFDADMGKTGKREMNEVDDGPSKRRRSKRFNMQQE